MAKLLQIDFPFAGPFGDDMAVALRELAESITMEPGFIWKIWTENAVSKQAGGIYLFADEQSAANYLAKHSARLAGFGIEGIRAVIFDINATLTRIDHGPLS
jgi:Putative mono-oxygenase ydhR